MKNYQDAGSQFVAKVNQVCRGAAAGAIGGLAASWAMNCFSEYSSHTHGSTNQPTPARQSKETEKSEEDATVKTAAAISRRVLHHELSDAEKKLAGPIVHYGYGAALGACYGALAEVIPAVSDGVGVPYAVLAWVAGDEVAVPALGLSKPPTEYSPSTHGAAFAAHVVYGVTLDLVRRVARHMV